MDQLYEFILLEGLEALLENGQITFENMLKPVLKTSDNDILECLMYAERIRTEDVSRTTATLHTEFETVQKLIEADSHKISRAVYAVSNDERNLAVERTSSEFEGIRPTRPSSVDPADALEQLRSEFDLVITHPLLRYLPHGSLKSLTVYSRHITVRHRENNDLYDIGFFRMLVPMCSPSDYRWYNLTRRVQGYSPERQHPHIFAEGYGCLGNARDMMAQALDHGDFYGMIHLGLRFLTSCQVRDLAGKYLVNWPKSE